MFSKNTTIGLIKSNFYLFTGPKEDLALVQNMIDNAPVNPSTGSPYNPFAAYGRPDMGDLLYKDNNGDGLINDEDRTTIGYGTAPRTSFGFQLGIDYNGFDFSALLQGNAGLKVIWRDLYYTTGVRWGYQLNQEIADGRWYDGRMDAKYPRLLNYTDNRNLVNSDFWLQDRTFMRVKNVQLGYTIPGNITQKAKIASLRGYVALENYFTFTSYKGFDPEVFDLERGSSNYPTLKQVLFGLNVTF